MVKLMKHQRNPHVKHFEGGKNNNAHPLFHLGESEPVPMQVYRINSLQRQRIFFANMF